MSEDHSIIEGFVIVAPDSDPRGFGDYIVLRKNTRQLYYWPRNLRLRGPTQEEIEACTSKTQLRELRESSFVVGQRVLCKVANEARGIVSSVRKNGNVQDDYQVYHGVLSFKTVCIISDGDQKQCRPIHLGPVDVDQEYVKEALPHVPFNGYIVFDVDEDALQCKFRLDHIDTDNPVVSNMIDYAGSAPWYTRGAESVEFLEEDGDVPEEVTRWREASQKDYRPQEKLEGRGFFVSMREIFCKAVKLWPVKVAWVDPLYQKDLWAGRLVKFNAYFCHNNNCYVVYIWREYDWPIPTQQGGQNPVQGSQVAAFKAALDPTGIAGIFHNVHVGYVYDDAKLVDGFEVLPGKPIYAYIEHCFHDGIYKFRLHSLAMEYYPQGLKPLPVEFCGKAYVIGLAGQLYAADLYAYKCLLPVEMRNHFRPGQVVRIKASCNAATGVFEVSEANAVHGEDLPVVVDRSTREVALKLTASCSTQHPMFFEHPDFGPIRSVSATNISVARVKKIKPVIKVVDCFDSPLDARYRFKCIAIERDGFH